MQDKRPNIELRVIGPDGIEDNSTFSLEYDAQKFETTLHMRRPQPGATYRVIAELSLGLAEEPEVIDRQEFDMVLEFRDAENYEPGFGFGVDWDSFSDNTDSSGAHR